MRIHLVSNSHIDPVWLWDKYEGIDEVLNTFRAACDRLDEYPDLTFAGSSIQFYVWAQQYDARLFERIARRVQEGRWEVVGGWWVEADTNLPGEASFVKHAEISQEFSRKYFGRESTVAYVPDSFGHPASLPKVLSRTGFKYLVFCRPNATEKPEVPANLFHWEYEGRRVLAYRLKYHYGQWGLTRESLLGMLNDEEYRANPVNAFLFGVGDHGGGPTIAEIELFNDYLKGRPRGDAGYSTCQRFFDEAASSPNIPVYRGDLHMHAVGCYSVLRSLKHAMRSGEEGLQHAARALEMKGESDAPLRAGWKTVLFNQFHDVLPGSCAPEAADQAEAEMRGVRSMCRDASYTALKSISMAHRPAVEEGEFRIFNTLPFDVTVPLHIEAISHWDHKAALRDAEGNEIPAQEVLASVRCGNARWEFVDMLRARAFKSYHFDNTKLVERAEPEAMHFHRADKIEIGDKRIGPDGVIFAGEPKKGARPLVEEGVRFLVLEDRSDTWGHGVKTYDSVEGAFAHVSSAVHEGPVTAKLYQQWAYGRSRLEIVYSLYKNLPGVYVELAVNWTENRKILKIEVHPAGETSSTMVMQGAGGPIERPCDRSELPMHHWVWMPASKGGLAVVQDGAFACDSANGRLRLTFVRSSVYSFHDPVKLDPADPQRLTDQGEHRMRFHLLERDRFDSGELDRLSAAFIEPYSVIRESPGA